MSTLFWVIALVVFYMFVHPIAALLTLLGGLYWGNSGTRILFFIVLLLVIISLVGGRL